MEYKSIGVDMDGTLTNETCWTPEDCLNATPKQSVIDYVNSLYKMNYIIINTARADELIPATIKWLRKHNVRYTAINNQKVSLDHHIDDKNLFVAGVNREMPLLPEKTGQSLPSDILHSS
jgi:uncharacterized HAD superfamily protein